MTTKILSEKQAIAKEKAKLYYQNHKEKLKEYARKRRKELKNTINRKRRESRANDPDKIEKQKRARQLPKQRWHQFRRAAVFRQKTFNVSYEQFLILIKMPCHYCNNELGKNSETGSGIDRLDNNIGYEPNNIVSCCTFCNKLKSNIFTEEEMKAVVNAIISVRKKNAAVDVQQQH